MCIFSESSVNVIKEISILSKHFGINLEIVRSDKVPNFSIDEANKNTLNKNVLDIITDCA